MAYPPAKKLFPLRFVTKSAEGPPAKISPDFHRFGRDADCKFVGLLYSPHTQLLCAYATDYRSCHDEPLFYGVNYQDGGYSIYGEEYIALTDLQSKRFICLFVAFLPFPGSVEIRDKFGAPVLYSRGRSTVFYSH